MLRVENLNIYPLHRPEQKIVKDLSFSLSPSESLGIMGVSGSGKTLTTLAILDCLPSDLKQDGDISWFSRSFREYSSKEKQLHRKKNIGYVFQDPSATFNPNLPLLDHFLFRMGSSYSKAYKPLKEILYQVGLDTAVPVERLQELPDSFSGGELQRLSFALALINKPALVIADEPTTALDPIRQQEIVILAKKLVIQNTRKTALIWISHDFYVLKEVCDRILIFDNGEIVEDIQAHKKWATQHAVTQRLVRPFQCLAMHSSIRTKYVDKKEILIKCTNLSKIHENRKTQQTKIALEDINFTLHKGDILALVGESGSGKTTLASCLVGLYPYDKGSIKLSPLLKQKRGSLQLLFQNPYAAMNPYLTVREIILEGLFYQDITKSEQERRLEKVCVTLNLPMEFLEKFPRHLSGGQIQRVALARSFITFPNVLILDEPTGNQDPLVEAQIIEELLQLQQHYSLSYIFITHNLHIATAIANQILVLHQGRVCDYGATEKILQQPQHPYTQKLLKAQNIPGS